MASRVGLTSQEALIYFNEITLRELTPVRVISADGKISYRSKMVKLQDII
jgi:hypothetical protein